MADPVKNYVVAFIFSEDRKQLALIHKNRPEWQAGMYNGIGGKIEDNEPPCLAITREIKEEGGIKMEFPELEQFCILTGVNKGEGIVRSRVNVFRAFTDKIYELKTMETEEINIFDVDSLPVNILPNLKWLIPFALTNGWAGEIYFP